MQLPEEVIERILENIREQLESPNPPSQISVAVDEEMQLEPVEEEPVEELLDAAELEDAALMDDDDSFKHHLKKEMMKRKGMNGRLHGNEDY